MELVDEITAYVDNELDDYPIKCRLGELIDLDLSIRQEFFVQKRIKDLLHKRFACCAIPFELKNKILSKIFQEKFN